MNNYFPVIHRNVARTRADGLIRSNQKCEILGMLPLDQLRGLPRDAGGSGLYFLWEGPALMYIGASRDVSQRLYYHHNAQRSGSWIESYRMKVLHTHATVLQAPKDELDDLERQYIPRFKPPYNDRQRSIRCAVDPPRRRVKTI